MIEGVFFLLSRGRRGGKKYHSFCPAAATAEIRIARASSRFQPRSAVSRSRLKRGGHVTLHRFNMADSEFVGIFVLYFIEIIKVI